MAKRHNWPVIERDYVEGIDDGNGNRKYPTQRDLGEKYGIDPATIGKRAKRDQWAIKREQFHSKISEKRQQKTAEVISAEGCDFSLKCYNIAGKIADKIEQMIDGGMECDPKGINALTAALKNVQSVADSTLGDNQANDVLEINVKMNSEESE